MTAKNLDSDKCIMVIGAHAADAEIMGGATVLKHVDAGWRAVMVHLTPGEKGHPVLSPEEYKEIKDVEAETAAERLGAISVMMDLRLELTSRMMRSTTALREQLCSTERLPGGLPGNRIVCPISPAVRKCP